MGPFRYHEPRVAKNGNSQVTHRPFRDLKRTNFDIPADKNWSFVHSSFPSLPFASIFCFDTLHVHCLPETKCSCVHRYLCMQMAKKWHPVFESVLAQIQLGDPQAQLVLLPPHTYIRRTHTHNKYVNTCDL